MSALIAGFLLVGYLLAPGAIYRLLFSFGMSSGRFQRTRTEEVTFSVLVTLLPFALSFVLLSYTPLGRFPSDTDGKLVGIYLINASRYAKDARDRDRGRQIEKPSEGYWRPIPGTTLYVVASTIANYNIRYVEPSLLRKRSSASYSMRTS